MITITPTNIPEVLLLEPRLWTDDRGYFTETYSQRAFAQISSKPFVQDNESYSVAGVVRGLHYQRPPYAQAKLVRVVQGAILDVAVDMRHGSPTYGQYVAVELSSSNQRQLYIPRGFAHGFAVLGAEARVLYKCDNPYMPEAEGTIRWDDPSLAIDWGVDRAQAKLSPKDLAGQVWQAENVIFRYGEEA